MNKNNLVLVSYPKNWGLDESLVIKLAKKALKERKLDVGVELSIVFVGKKKAKDLNIKYRKMDYIPQVLGFPMNEKVNKDGLKRLGDIVICTQKLKYEVEYQKSTLKKVLYEWLLHGVDNLLK